MKVCRPSSSHQPSGTSSQIFPSSETQDDIVWQICFSSKRKKIYLGVCVCDGTGSWEEQGKGHASPRQIVRFDDLVSGSDDSGGGGVRSDRAKVLYWHWKAYGSDGRSVARNKKTIMIYQPLLPLLGNHTSYCRRWRHTDSFVLVQLAAGSQCCSSERVDRPHFSESFCC